MGKFHSTMLTCPRNGAIPLALADCARIIRESYMTDDLKAPLGNPAKPAMISKPANNFYFGLNISSGGSFVNRAAYAVGSGVSTIGLNPLTMKVHPFFPRLLHLHSAVTNHVRTKTRWKGASFAHCAVKVYYTFRDSKHKLVKKTTEWHVDVTRDANGIPLPNNSQVPGSPVAILTFGDPKRLYFRRHRDRHNHLEDSTLSLLQKSGSFFLLDPRDEMLDCEGLHWRHCSGPSEGVTISFMFREVQRQVKVHPTKSTLAEPKLGPKKRRQFEEGEKIFSTEHYKRQRLLIDNKLDRVLCKRGT